MREHQIDHVMRQVTMRLEANTAQDRTVTRDAQGNRVIRMRMTETIKTRDSAC